MQAVAAAGRVELPLHVVALAQSYPCPRGKVFAARRIETIWQRDPYQVADQVAVVEPVPDEYVCL